MRFISWLFGTATKPAAVPVAVSVAALSEKAIVWPNTMPIDKTDPHWEFNNNCFRNGIEYKKAEVDPGQWQWVVDEHLMSHKRQRNQDRRALGAALRTRVLTEEELNRAIDMGFWLYVEEMVSYRGSEKQSEFDSAILQQYRIRAIAGVPVLVLANV